MYKFTDSFLCKQSKENTHNFSHIAYENHVLSACAKFIYQFYPFSADFFGGRGHIRGWAQPHWAGTPVMLVCFSGKRNRERNDALPVIHLIARQNASTGRT